VLTKIVMFGGNIVFAFHTDGRKQKLGELLANEKGFNVCTDLLLPKRAGEVTRLHHLENVSRYWRTRFAKATVEFRRGAKAKEWFIYKIDQLEGEPIARVSELNAEYRQAMDNGCYSFDMVAEKIQQSYTPDQNEHI
jgi:hypothetical protein